MLHEALSDMDFGITWGASHSLIQAATYDNNYFWTAALSDAYPEGIRVEYTSKKISLVNMILSIKNIIQELQDLIMNWLDI